MTILPKTPSGHPGRGEDRGSGVGANPRDNAQNSNSQFDQPVGGNSNAPGWVPSVVASPSGSGWSPGGPAVAQGASSSPRWSSSSGASSSSMNQVEGPQVNSPGSGSASSKNKKRAAPSSGGGPPSGPRGPTGTTGSPNPPPPQAPPPSASFYSAFDYLDEDDIEDLDEEDLDEEEEDYDGDVGDGPTSTKRGRHCCDRDTVAVGPHCSCRDVARDVAGGAIAVPASVANAVNAVVAAAQQNRTSPEPGSSSSVGVHQGSGPGGVGPTADGYNSEDEYSHYGVQLSEEEWVEKDRRFDRTMKRKGYVIKKMKEDGSCLFRAVADQIYGDQEMHAVVRDHCMNYIEQNGDYYSQYMTEAIADYVERKRFLGVHGNHLEIQALSEMYNRPIHIYCYSAEPINIFQSGNVKSESHINVPMRLCYHRAVHYNSIVDPNKPDIGVGLGLPNYSPRAHDRNTIGQALKKSEEDAVEKAMLEDKIRATDWEATNEAIEEQVARESYLAWLRDNEKRNTGGSSAAAATRRRPVASTVTSGELRLDSAAAAAAGAARPPTGGGGTTSPSEAAAAHLAATAACTASLSSPSRSPKPGCSFRTTNSPRAGCSSERDSPKPGGSSSPKNVNSSKGFQWSETATFLNGLPPGLFGPEGWNETDVLTKVLAASQQEYLDSLKKKSLADKQEESDSLARRQQQEDPTKSDKKQKSKSSSPSKSNNNNNR